jgi:hypothetical protein
LFIWKVFFKFVFTFKQSVMETQYTEEQLIELYHQLEIEAYYSEMTEAEYYELQMYCNDF